MLQMYRLTRKTEISFILWFLNDLYENFPRKLSLVKSYFPICKEGLSFHKPNEFFAYVNTFVVIIIINILLYLSVIHDLCKRGLCFSEKILKTYD